MKPRLYPSLRPALLAAAAIACCVGATPNANAGTYYWDTDGSGTPGFGTASGTWGSSAFWGTDSAGSGATANTTIGTSDDVNFGTASAGLASGTITGPSTAQGFLNMTFGSASGTVNLSGGKLNLSSAGSTITVNNTAATLTNTILQGASGKLIKSGSGKLTLNVNTANKPTYTGATVVDEGILELIAVNTTATALASSSSITINDGGTILVSADNSFQGYDSSSAGKLTINAGGLMTTSSGVTAWIRGALELNGGELASHATTDSGYGTWTLGQNVTAIGAVTSTMSASQMNWAQATTRTFTVSDAAGILNVTGTFARPSGFSGGFTGSLNKAGLGTMVLKGTNTYTGLTTVTEGKLSFGLGGSARNSSGFTVESGATLELDTVNVFATNHSTAVDKVITVNGGTLLMTANSEARIGNVTLNNGATWTSNRGLAYYDILLANTSTGAATVAVTGNAASLMNGSGGIHLEGVQNFDVADVTSSAAADLTVSMILADRLFGTAATGGITKSGAGTMVLSNTNTYTGATNVNAGKLVIGTGGSLAATTVTVGGATATGTPTLGGVGTIGGATTIAAAGGGVVGHHAPGIEGVSGGVGTQAFSSDLTYGNGSIFEWDINANSTSTGFDKVTVTGNIIVGTGTEFKINLGSSVFASGDFTNAAFWKTPYGPQTWAMSDIFSKAFSSGAFASVTTVQDVSSYGSFTINGTSLTWTAVPEPTSALAGLLITAGLLRRRRKF